MAAIGENIGNAYIRIYADGSNFPESARRAVDGADNVFAEEGEKHGEAYEKGFNKSAFSGKGGDRLRKKLIESIGLHEGASADLGHEFWTKIENDLTKSYGQDDFGQKIVDRMMSSLRESFVRSGGSRDIFGSALSRIGSLYLDTYKQVLKDEERATVAAAKRDEQVAKALTAAYEEENRQRLADDKAAAKEQERLERQRTQMLALQEKARVENARRADAEIADLRARAARLGLTTTDPEVIRTEERRRESMRLFRVEVDKTSEAVARAFGKGSRNDLLNFTGALMGGMNRIMTTTGALVFSLDAVTHSLLRSRREGLTWAQSFDRVFGPDFFGRLTAGFRAIALGGVAAAGALGPLSAALMDLGGIVAAAGGSLGFAAGSLAALGPIATAAAASLGVVGLAFIGMDEAAKKATKEALEPYKEALTDLGDTARGPILKALNESAREFTEGMERLDPVVRKVSEAVGDNLAGSISSLNGREFRAFTKAMEDYLPDAVRDLGSIFGNTGTAMMGTFRAAIPLAEEFTGWLDDITDRWSVFANSRDGQRQMTEFFDGAGESAAALGDALGGAWHFLKELGAAGKDVGDGLFRDLGEEMRSWGDWIKANPDIMDAWFEGVDEFAHALGGVIQSLGGVVGALATPQATHAVDSLLDGISSLLDGMAAVLPAVATLGNAFVSGLGGALDVLGGLLDLLSLLPDEVLALGAAYVAFSRMASASTLFGAALTDVEGKATRLGTVMGRLRSPFTALALSAGVVGATMSESGSAIDRWSTMLGFTAAGLAMFGPAGAAVGAAVGGLRLLNAGMGESKKAADDLLASIDGLSALESLGQSSASIDALSQSFAELGKHSKEIKDDLNGESIGKGFAAMANLTIEGFQQMIPGLDSIWEKQDKIAKQQGELERVRGSWEALASSVLGAGTGFSMAFNDTQLENFASVAERALSRVGTSVEEFNQMKPYTDEWYDARDAISYYVDGMRDGRTGSMDLRDAMNALGDETTSTTDAARALSDAFDMALGRNVDRIEATDRVATSLRNMRDAFKENGSAVIGSSEAAIKNRAAILDQVKAIERMATAQVDAGDSAEQVRGSFAKNIDALKQTALNAGVTERDWRRLTKEMNLTPETVEAILETRGSVKTAIGQFTDFRGLVDYIDGYVARAGIDADSKKGKAELDRFKRQIDKAMGQMGIDANSKEGRAVLAALKREIDRANASVNVDADTSGAKSKMDFLISQYAGRTINMRVVPKGTAPNSVAGNATGTDAFGGGLSWVGEQGKELMVVPNGAKIVPNHQTESFLETLRLQDQARREKMSKVEDYSDRSSSVTVNVYTTGDPKAAAHEVVNALTKEGLI